MNRKITLLFFVFLSPYFVFSQNFFPLKVGNKYQIKNDWYEQGHGGYYQSGTNYYALSVSRDTLIDGLTYYEIINSGDLSPYPETFFFRYDSLNQKVFIVIPGDDTIRLACDFTVPADSVYISYLRGEPGEFISHGLSPSVVLGDSVTIYRMSSNDNYSGYRYYFADKIGLYYFNYAAGFIGYNYSSTHLAISARIDSLILSPLILRIDTIYPVIDRPIDTFPFLLNIPYTASYYQLINSFFLTTQLVRSDSVISTIQTNISRFNPSITFNIPDLEVGDIIKLKATITDNSIYNNIDVYPDTGWLIINVLPAVVGIKPHDQALTFKLNQNYPNPFNSETIIAYQVPEYSSVVLEVYDVLGRKLKTLVNEEKQPGTYEVRFSANSESVYSNNLASGIYFYRISIKDFVQTKKMIQLR